MHGPGFQPSVRATSLAFFYWMVKEEEERKKRDLDEREDVVIFLFLFSSSQLSDELCHKDEWVIGSFM